MDAQKKLTVSIAGSGNVGSFLATELFKAGCVIRQVFSRTHENAQKLASKVDAEPIVKIDSIDFNIHLLIIALPDKVIPGFCEVLSKVTSVREGVTRSVVDPNPDICIASTAGSVMLSEFSQYFNHCGVLYPLQSFTLMTQPDAKIVPFCIEGTDEQIKSLLTKTALLISDDVRFINSEQRLILHMAAVFASNFSNHLLAIASSIIRQNNLDFNILWPLINETVGRLKECKPEEVQTGPAIRNDIQTMEKHLELLDGYRNENFKLIYEIISRSIYQMSTKHAGED